MPSTITVAQKVNAIHPVIRVSATVLFAYWVRNTKDLQPFRDEVSAMIDKKTLLELYQIATRTCKADGKRQERDVFPEFRHEAHCPNSFLKSLYNQCMNIKLIVVVSGLSVVVVA